MRQSLFRLVATLAGTCILFISRIGAALSGLVSGTFGAIALAIQKIAHLALGVIDKELHEYSLRLGEQRSCLSELDLVMAAQRVRDDALQGRVWTMTHTVAMNRIGMELHSSHGWEPTRVHGYLRSVIEAIPNLRYEVDDENRI